MIRIPTLTPTKIPIENASQFIAFLCLWELPPGEETRKTWREVKADLRILGRAPGYAGTATLPTSAAPFRGPA